MKYAASIALSTTSRASRRRRSSGNKRGGEAKPSKAGTARPRASDGGRLAGAALRDVVRTRIYVTDIDQWEAIARAHGEAFASIRPACTMVEVSRLIAPEILLEIEAEAIIDEARS